MSDATAPTPEAAKPHPKRRRLWLWFVGGFTFVFIGLLLFLPANFYDGRTVRAMVLWQYYLLEIQLELDNQGFVGPTSRNWQAAGSMALQHVLVSAIAGAIVMGVGWATQKRTPTTKK